MHLPAKILSLSIFITLLLFGIIGCSNSGKGEELKVRQHFINNTLASNNSGNTIMPEITLPDSRTKAPDFPKDFAWVNTDRPLYINSELKGRIVVLDFWTYCCINCMHILPDLAYIEDKYKDDPVAIIGVHSAKFDNEGDSENIKTACYRYNIKHPVIVDENHRIWSEYGVRSWPTLLVIDPEGKIIGKLSGEGNRETLDAVISALLKEGEEKGTLASGPPEFKPHNRVPSSSGLAFPGKILAIPDSDLLFISDSNHNRIIVTNSNGEVTAIAGSGKSGQANGSFAKAEFKQPQGMAYDEDNQILYVADTENHTIRKLDLKDKTITTISGTGHQVYDRSGGGAGIDQGLNSPWDLVLKDGILYIAMAGPHQLWTLDLETMIAKAWAGSGLEDIIDGNGTATAALAQPSGLVILGDWIYFADSEVSAVRRVNIDSRKVETLIGSGLFNFGDRVGAFSQSLLQHPLGVAVHNNEILVADTYNHRIKRLDLDLKKSFYLAGSGDPDLSKETAHELSLYEPGGLSVAGDILYIADTNHDRIIRYNLANNTFAPLELKGLRVEQSRRMDLGDVVEQRVKIKSQSKLDFRLQPDLPKGVHLNAEAPVNWSFMEEGDSGKGYEGVGKRGVLPLDFSLDSLKIDSNKSYLLTMDIAYCTDTDKGLCIPATVVWRLNFEQDTAAPERIVLIAPIEPVN
jgi:thiol-disulfide isomerase/thioredoxin